MADDIIDLQQENARLKRELAEAVETGACVHDRLGIRILELEKHIRSVCGKSKDGCPSIITNCACCKCILNSKNKSE